MLALAALAAALLAAPAPVSARTSISARVADGITAMLEADGAYEVERAEAAPPAGGGRFAALLESGSASEMELFGAAAEEGLSETDSAATTSAIDAHYDRISDKALLAAHVYHVLHFIHEAHLGLELTEISVHKVSHNQQLQRVLRTSLEMFKTNVQALRKVYAGHGQAFSTVNTWISAFKTSKELPGIVAKTTDPKQKRLLQGSLAEINAMLTRTTPKMQKAAAYLAEHAKAIRSVRAQWFAQMGPMLAEVRAISRLPAAAAQPKTAALMRRFAHFRTSAATHMWKVVTHSDKIVRASRFATRFATGAMKLALSHGFIHKVMFVGVAVEAAHGMITSKAETTAGMIATGVLKGGIGFIVMRNPIFALCDLLLLPKSLSITKNLGGAADYLVGAAEFVFAGNPKMLQNVHKYALEGKSGYFVNLGAAIFEAANGNQEHLFDLNRRNLAGANGALLHFAAATGALIAGNPLEMAKYQQMALAGEHGKVAKYVAVANDYFANGGFQNHVAKILGSVYAPPSTAFRVIPRPDAKGLYFKIESCVGLKEDVVSRPIFHCRPIRQNRFNRRQSRLTTSRTTSIGQKKPNARNTFRWDHTRGNPGASGFGILWRGMTFTNQVMCTLSNSVPYWADTNYPGTYFIATAGPTHSAKLGWSDIVLYNKGKMSGAYCRVAIDMRK